jgi:hypothetical protein
MRCNGRSTGRLNEGDPPDPAARTLDRAASCGSGIDGTALKSGPTFAHVVPGRSIQRIEIGTQTADNSGKREQIPAILISIAPSDLEKIRALEASARQFATNEVGAAPRTISLAGNGRLRAWGKPTDLDRLRLQGDLHVLMTFEEPERGLTAYDSGGSMYSDSNFRILGITGSTSVDPTGKARSAFHWSR